MYVSQSLNYSQAAFQGHSQLHENQNAVLQGLIITMHGSYAQRAAPEKTFNSERYADPLRTGLVLLGWSLGELTSILHSCLHLFCVSAPDVLTPPLFPTD